MKPIERASGPDERRRPDGGADTPDGSTGEGDADPEPFRPLGEYEWPSTPVDRGIKRLVGTVRKRLFADDEGEGIDLSRLAAAERSVLDEIVAPPANRPLMNELDATLADWLDGADEEGDALFSHVRVVVLPPCDEEDFIRGWSEAHGFALLEAPDRSGRADPPELPGQPGGIVVVPRLGDWFLRHDTALAGIVALFERPYGAGDWVEIDGDYGEVVSVGLRAIRLRTAADNLVTVPHGTLWEDNVSNASGGARTLMCIAHFHLLPEHDPDRVEAALVDVGLTSAYLDYAQPVFVVLNETGHGTHYQLKAYPFDSRDQFFFVSELTARGKAAIRRAGGTETSLAGFGREGEPA